MSSTDSEASQPLISHITQQADTYYTRASHSINTPTSLSSSHQLTPSHQLASSTSTRPHWYTSCLPSTAHDTTAHEDKSLLPGNVVYKNWHRSHYSDLYYWALRFRWLPFVLVVLALFFAQVLLFATLNHILLLSTEQPLSQPLSFTDLLLLHLGVSAGYGTGSFTLSASGGQHLLLSLEALARTLYFTLVTVINTQVQLVVSVASTTNEGKPWRHFHTLDLTRSTIPTFLFPWTLIHTLDATSPLYNLTPATALAQRLDLHCVVTAVDSVFGGSIWARHRYGCGELRFGWRPADVFVDWHVGANDEVLDGQRQQQHVRVIDMARFDEMERDDSGSDRE